MRDYCWQILSLILGGAVVALAVVAWSQRAELIRTGNYLRRYEERYQWLIGGSAMPNGEVVNYRYLSLDGGRHWYDVRRDDDGEQIVGPARQDVLDHSMAMRTLMDYGLKRGRVDPTSPEDRRLLEAAGFTVEARNP